MEYHCLFLKLLFSIKFNFLKISMLKVVLLNLTDNAIRYALKI